MALTPRRYCSTYRALSRIVKRKRAKTSGIPRSWRYVMWMISVSSALVLLFAAATLIMGILYARTKQYSATALARFSRNGRQTRRLTEQISKFDAKLDEARRKKERAIARAQLTKSGFVYVISNIGSFGELQDWYDAATGA